jgi:DnaJ-class molecular chaperone
MQRSWPGKDHPRDCETCGGVGAVQRIRELEAARDSQVEMIKRLRAQLHGRTG